MKTKFLLSALICSLSAVAQQKTLEVCVSNTWSVAKTDEPVVLKLGEVKKLNFAVASAVVSLDGKDIPCQLDDMNGDMTADELIFLADIGAGENQTYTVTLSADGVQKDYVPRVYCDMMLDDKKGKHPFITSIETPGKSYIYSDLYHHGAAFESELTAFRVYFDKRQNIDIYGKRLRRLELADTHFYTTAEQLKHDYGNDVLWAGGSVGCGTFKGWDGQKPVDIENLHTRGQRIIAAGPLRTVVEVKDLGWRLGESVYNMRQYYTLYAGHRECEVRVCFDSPLRAADTFCTGVQKVGSAPEGMTRSDGVAASWGSDYPEMGQKELFPPETVGLAVYVPTEYIREQRTDNLNYLYILGAEGKKEMRYYVAFCADKERDGYHSSQEWFGSLDAWKAALNHPVKVNVKK